MSGRRPSQPTAPTGVAQTIGVLILAVVALSALACAESVADPARSPVDTPRGMVSSAHPEATQAGLDVLEAGGNAFDAAVAVAATLTVVEPMNSNLFGGYGTLLIFDAEQGKLRYLDNNGRFPAATNSDVFRAAPDRSAIMRTAQAVSTPGNLQGFERLWQELGTSDWEGLFGHAIDLAENGVPVSRTVAGAIKGAFEHFPESAQGFYGTDGEALGEGELLVQQDLAKTLRAAATDGASVLVEGWVADALEAEMTRRGGFLARSDLEAHVADWLEPISIDYRGYEVATAGPPSNSFASLVCLGIMGQHDVATLGHNTPEFLHAFAEATKHAFWTRLAYAGGPEENPPPLERILGDSYFTKQAAALTQTASTFEPPGAAVEGEDTTHFVVADAAGNVVSATITLGQGFGSAVMVEGTGIWLNNSMAFSTYEPAGNPMDAIGGARKHSSKTPTIILRDGVPWVAIGTPGGHTIPQTTPQMVMNLIDFGMTVQEAVDAPRVSFAEPDVLLIEKGVDDETVAALEARGHKVDRRAIGLAHGVSIERDAEGVVTGFSGGADSRGVGVAKAAKG